MTPITDASVRAQTWRHWDWRPAAPQIYLGSVIVAGMFVLAMSIRSLISAPWDPRLTLLVALTVAGSQLMLRMPAFPVSFSISDIFTFATALMFGPGPAAVVVAVDAAVLSTRLVRSQRSATRYLFNASAGALAMSVSAGAFFALSRTPPLAADPSAIVGHVGSLAAFAILYFVGEYRPRGSGHRPRRRAAALAGVARALHVLVARVCRRRRGRQVALFLMSTQHGDFRVLAFVMPFPFILYVTFRTAVGRMQDDVAHLTRINTMYLATIETLAHAVDARDQVDARSSPAGADKCHAARARVEH